MSEFNNGNNENNKIESTEELPISNYSGYNASHSSDYDSNSNTSYDYELNSTDSNKKKPKRGGRIAAYIAVGLVCSVVSGTAAGISSMYILPKTSFFKNTPLYQSLASATSTNGYTSSSSTVSASPTTATTSGALTVSQIAKKVGPAVVGVSTKSITANQYGYGNSEEDGVGSGIIIDKSGYILTNYHVISGAQKITITFNNKKTASAKVVNYDSNLDIAVIKVTDSNVTMPAVAELGSSSTLEVGDSVVAIGNPMGLEFFGTVTTGVVSALNRQVSVENSNSPQTLIQTDAAINSGNSGGPLVNSQGQVIGITSSKLTGGTEGIGFAIPIDLVKPKISSLTKQMIVLGVSVEDVSQSDASASNIPQGAAVVQVTAGSSADKAGIESGDIITKFGGSTIKSTSDLNTAKSKYNAGDKVPVQVYSTNDGSTKNLTITLSN